MSTGAAFLPSTVSHSTSRHSLVLKRSVTLKLKRKPPAWHQLPPCWAEWRKTVPFQNSLCYAGFPPQKKPGGIFQKTIAWKGAKKGWCFVLFWFSDERWFRGEICRYCKPWKKMAHKHLLSPTIWMLLDDMEDVLAKWKSFAVWWKKPEIILNKWFIPLSSMCYLKF